MIQRSARLFAVPSRRELRFGVSALALVCAAQPLAAQEQTTPPPSNEVEPSKPAGDGAAGTFSGATGADAGTGQTVQGAASTTSGTSGSSDTVDAAPPETGRDEIVVTGIRQSLANAQNIKRNSDTVVDAITAEDIGALPDRSVNEALQRVPGVAISRFAAPTDSQHFSAQGSGVVIRGLSYVRGEFNGRDAFAVGGGREIGFNDIPTELVGSIEVFKNLTADLIEGGISGTVNINTRKPFDSNKDLLFLSGGINYGDLERRGAPQGVALVSKQWDLASGGRFGALASVTYQQLRSRADSVFTAAYLPRFNDDTNGNGTQDAGEGRTINAGTAFSSTLFDRYPVPAGRDFVYAPLGGGSRSQSFNRRRFGISGGLQYENADRTFLATGQFLRTESIDEWIDRTVEPEVYYGDATTVFPVTGRPVTYNDDGVFTSGTLGRQTGIPQGNSPRGIDANQDGVLDRNGDGSLVTYGPLVQFAPDGIQTKLTNRHFYSKSTTQDQSLNLKWQPTDRLRLNLDGQYITSKLKNYDDIVDVNTFSQVLVNVEGKNPVVESITPTRDVNAYFANPGSFFFRNAYNGRQDNDGREFAFRGDLEYEVSEDSFFRNARVGGRYSDRKQTVRSHDYTNWGNLSEVWAGNGPISFNDIPGSGQLFGFADFFRGKTSSPPASVFVPGEVISDHDAFTDLMRRAAAAGGGSYVPLEDRTAPDGGELIKGFFLPNEIYRNREKTYSAYARVDFGADDFAGGLKLAGNIGLRFVRTESSSDGALTLPNQTNIFTADTTTPPRYTDLTSYCAFQQTQLDPGENLPSICTVSAGQQASILAFANGASFPDSVTQKYNHWLPSLNVRLDLSDELLFRLAASKAISRPNFADLRNFTGVSPSGGNGNGNFGFQASARNPFLRPVEAEQVDLTAEWYFAKVGSLTGAVFYKNLSNIIVDNLGYTRTVTNNGATFDVGVNGPANVDGNADIKGFEVAYQQTYDFLPGPLRGLGLQATYTYVDAGNIPNGVPANAANDGNRPPADVGGLYDNLPLTGLSKHNVNVSGFYDLGGFYARVAYSWRSGFLLNNRDCCFPFLPIFARSTGQVDASMFFTVNPNFKIGVEAQNLLDQTTITDFLLNGDGTKAFNRAFKNDRQFTLSTRLTF